MCKRVLTDDRASLTPFMFECLTFLKANRAWWGLPEVAMAIRMSKNKHQNEREEKDYEAFNEVLAALNELGED